MMQKVENQLTVLKWIAGIAGTMVASLLVWAIMVINSVDVMGKQIDQNSIDIKALREFHIYDVSLTRSDIQDIKDDQKEIKKDIKEILQRLPK